MKKVLSLLLATVMLFNLTACNKQKIYTAEQVQEIVAPYMRGLSIGLSDNWCGSEDDRLLAAVGGDIFKAMLESIWRKDIGTEIYDENYVVKLEDYVSTATEYFAYDKEFLTIHFRADDSYNSAEETLLSADGLGSVHGGASTDGNNIVGSGSLKCCNTCLNILNSRVGLYVRVYLVNQSGVIQHLQYLVRYTEFDQVRVRANKGLLKASGFCFIGDFLNGALAVIRSFV